MIEDPIVVWMQSVYAASLPLLLLACSPQTPASTAPGEGAELITGGTGVDHKGRLLRSRPDPDAPRPDPLLAADDEANLLFMAGALSEDEALMKQVWRHLGLADEAGEPTPKMVIFMRAHGAWQQNAARSIDKLLGTPEKARAYVKERLKTPD